MEKNNKTLNVPNLRFPEFSGEWEKGTLQSVATLSKGTGISKDQLSEDGQPCILYGELYTKYKSEIIDVIISKTDIDSQKLVRSQTNDVIIPCSGESAVDIATARCVKQSNVLLGGDLNIIRLKGEHDGSFFAYQLNGKRKYDIAKLAQGVSVVHLYGEHLKGVKVNYPSAAEQKKISSLLALIDQRIKTQKKIIEKYESLIKGITDKVFYAPHVYFLRSFGTLYKDAGEGGTPSTSNPQYYENGTIPFIKIDDLSKKYLVAHKDCITELGLKNSSAWLIPTGSVIYSNGATIGAISINTYPVSTKQGILGIIPNDSVCAEYLYYLMTSKYFRKQVHRIITEGTMKTAYLKDINRILCPVPDKNEQQSLAKSISLVTRKIETEKATLEAFILHKRYLLSHLFI